MHAQADCTEHLLRLLAFLSRFTLLFLLASRLYNLKHCNLYCYVRLEQKVIDNLTVLLMLCAAHL